jgi:phosphopantothenoylcysteine decarboxylase/phosphopantothenate--cysteine ligase
VQGVLWPNLVDKKVLLAVSGGIAAYKAAELCRLLVRVGAQVQVMMTAAAREFVGETTFAALSGRPVATDLFDPIQEATIGHIGLADEADLLIAAPATADLLARFANGLANDLVSTVYLAHRGPVLLAPAMNVRMWQHPATGRNMEVLQERGHVVVGPDEGDLACGHHGAGRMAEPPQIVEATAHCLSARDLIGRRVLVSAGPTHESIDPVRFIANRSSGKMGYAVAAEAAARGGRVFLVSGPTGLPAPYGVERIEVTTAGQMAEALLGRAEDCDLVVMAAAVADYRPAAPAEQKIKKEAWGDSATLSLERTTDILVQLGQRRTSQQGQGQQGHDPLLVGFAAETGDPPPEQVRGKLRAKGCDLLVLNDVAAPDAGFDVTTNRAVIHDAQGGASSLALMSKRELASRIIDRVVSLWRDRAK